MAKHLVRVDFIQDDKYGLNGNLSDAIEFLREALERIPEEFRSSARLELDIEYPYGGEEIRIRIVYWRPMTREELKHRRDLEKAQRELRDSQEKEELKRLKAKYGDI